ncbi:DUF6538 domain-containing protein [Manganibacter manganicus]|uniref:Core-binding (CB) domain-containing protein n=1 Tax=Manganibacter manganicus TaxID=1873176 RepID=A0A1V8RK95_9HYPH|nr:DUF6538 domain-containing protein [Pseudaminobacter manganicus]OQM73631.1 hypothetical protein BFN67_06790 [Pseudaminobacter manganicus]
MTGPWPHPNTGILYYRKVTPPDIFAERRRLAELGVKVTREVQRSLGTRDRKPAERLYKEVSGEVEAEWDRWRLLLREGPQDLSPKQTVALAAEHARAFLAKHEEDAFEAPPESPIPNPPDDGNTTMLAMVDAMEPDKRKDFERDIREYVGAGAKRKRSLTVRLLSKYPGLRAILGRDVAAALEAIHGADSDEALANRRLHVTAESRRLLNLQMASMMGAVHRGLEARRGNDYSRVKELEAAPDFVVSSPSTEPSRPANVLTLERLLDHKAKTTSIRAKTVSDNRAYLTKFVAFIGHDDARKVAKDDVRRWRDSLMETGLSPKTITDKYLSAVRAVLTHGVKEFDLPFNAASGIADNREGVAPKRSKGWTEEEAARILKATFGGTSKAISEPHKRALFWMPWVLAYTGLRAAEIGQFQGRHLKEEDGIPYLLITPSDGSTKSGKAWAVGIHKHLIELGFLDFIREIGEGPLFYEPYPADTDLKALKGKHRGTEVGKRVGQWVTEELKMEAPLGRPLHALRHLFTTRSRHCGMDKEARDFMMGSGPVDAREGYGEWPPAVLDREINKLPRFAVMDTGWRP